MRRNVEDWDVLSLEEKCYEAVWNSKSLTLYEKFHPWNLTDHGCKELQNDDELNAYMVAYGEMHIVKCRAALQNFPFEELERQGVYFEIIDWGCGQGLATLTLLQMLFERQKISRLRRITLVELSKAASKRAGDWVKVWLKNYNNVVVKTVNKPIPNDVNDRMDEVDCKEYVCINLFSNILDIRQLSLKWLADKTSSLAAENYMVCVGPNLQKNTRIQDFCGYFSPKKYFTNFAVKNLGLTSRTHYKFGCEAKGFMHRNGWRKNGNYQEKAGDFLKIDDYDFALREVANDYGEAVANFYEQFRAAAEELSLCENSIFDVYYRPSFQGDEVDFVLATKTKGFVLINVLRENGCKMYNSEEGIAYERIMYERIKRIKDNFYDHHCKDLGLDCIGRRTLYGNIKIGLLFVDCDKDEALQKAKNVDKHLKAFSAKMVKQDIIEFIHRLPNQDGKYYDDIVSIIAPDWHSYRDGNDKVKPSPHQTKVIKNSAKRLAVKGVAGCGKTFVLANRAVYKHQLTRDRVLILTYNVALTQYIVKCINEVPADFRPSMFEVYNYHKFFRLSAERYKKRNLELEDYDKVDFFESCKDTIAKYKTIIIDEIQDFNPIWVEIVTKYFLAEDGSVSVFGDGAQSLYGHKIDNDTGMPNLEGCGFDNRWHVMVGHVLRSSNKKIVSLASNFAQEFCKVKNHEQILPLKIGEDDGVVKYACCGSHTPDFYSKSVLNIILKYRLKERNVAVLATNVDLLRAIDICINRNKVEGTYGNMLALETQHQYDLVFERLEKEAIDDDKKQLFFDIEIERLRSNIRSHFTTDCDSIKISTIHSFKGWESDTIILILPNKNEVSSFLNQEEVDGKWNEDSLVYTALTRAKRNLFIIGSSNSKYHEFFSRQLPSR